MVAPTIPTNAKATDFLIIVSRIPSKATYQYLCDIYAPFKHGLDAKGDAYPREQQVLQLHVTSLSWARYIANTLVGSKVMGVPVHVRLWDIRESRDVPLRPLPNRAHVDWASYVFTCPVKNVNPPEEVACTRNCLICPAEEILCDFCCLLCKIRGTHSEECDLALKRRRDRDVHIHVPSYIQRRCLLFGAVPAQLSPSDAFLLGLSDVDTSITLEEILHLVGAYRVHQHGECTQKFRAFRGVYLIFTDTVHAHKAFQILLGAQLGRTIPRAVRLYRMPNMENQGRYAYGSSLFTPGARGHVLTLDELPPGWTLRYLQRRFCAGSYVEEAGCYEDESRAVVHICAPEPEDARNIYRKATTSVPGGVSLPLNVRLFNVSSKTQLQPCPESSSSGSEYSDNSGEESEYSNPPPPPSTISDVDQQAAATERVPSPGPSDPALPMEDRA